MGNGAEVTLQRREASSSENDAHGARFGSLKWGTAERAIHSLQRLGTFLERECCDCRMARSPFRNQMMGLQFKRQATHTSEGLERKGVDVARATVLSTHRLNDALLVLGLHNTPALRLLAADPLSSCEPAVLRGE